LVFSRHGIDGSIFLHALNWKEARMKTQVNTIEPQSGKFPQAVIWIAGIALTLFCAVGIAALMGWIPNSMGGASDKAAVVPVASVVQQSANTVPDVPPKARRAAVSRPAPAAHTAPEPVAPPPVASVPAAPAKIAALATCAECGVIESVREVDTKGQGSGLGAVGGAVVGGLVGNQVGAGRGKSVMAVVGAVGGALAGNEVEKRVKTTKSYDVTVRLNDGSSRVIREASLPTWHIGDKVKVINGAIQSNA
jgi:outer membrane lipoprotein SlyB